MAAPSPKPIDIGAALYSFFLHSYVARFSDPRHTPEEQLGAQMDIESMMLHYGPATLREIQRGLNVGTGRQDLDVQAAEWFMRFVSSLDEGWLSVVSLSTIEHFWRVSPDMGVRRAAIELLARVEAVGDPLANAAHVSVLVALFREVQPEPFATPMSAEGELIIRTLLTRAKLLSLTELSQAPLARYALRVVRYCFKDQYQTMSAEEIESAVSLAGELSDRSRLWIYSGLI